MNIFPLWIFWLFVVFKYASEFYAIFKHWFFSCLSDFNLIKWAVSFSAGIFNIMRCVHFNWTSNQFCWINFVRQWFNSWNLKTTSKPNQTKPNPNSNSKPSVMNWIDKIITKLWHTWSDFTMDLKTAFENGNFEWFINIMPQLSLISTKFKWISYGSQLLGSKIRFGNDACLFNRISWTEILKILCTLEPVRLF